jgi:hypothetical protein
MKVRTGFVSNSSCSGFAISKKHVSAHQRDLIYNHIEKAKECEMEGTYHHHASCGDAWDIWETEDFIIGSTIMDNFDMHHYLEHVVGIDPELIRDEGEGY